MSRLHDARPGLTRSGTNHVALGDGSPLVFAHGCGMNLNIWQPQLDHFAHTHKTFAYDMLGHGASPLPPAAPRMSDYVDQLHRLLDDLDLRSTSLVGHSLGALVSLGFALAHPERVDRVVVLNAVYGGTPEHYEAVRQRARRLAEQGVEATLDGTLRRWFGEHLDEVDQTKVEAVKGWLRATDPTGYARAYGLFSQSHDIYVGRLPELRVPALFMTGEGDPNSTPGMSRAMAHEAPLGQVQVVPGERHMLPFTAPAEVNQRIAAFLGDGSAVSPGEPAATPSPVPGR